MRLTTALYYTPAGRSIQEVGITPDLVVQQSDEPELGFPRRRRVREKDLEGHFTQKDATGLEEGNPAPPRILEHDAPPTEGPADVDGDGAETDPEGLAAQEPEEKAEPEDAQLTRAVEVLKSWTYFEDLRKLRGDEDPATAGEATIAAADRDED